MMRYCEISKEMSLLYFVLGVFCQFEARVPEFYAVFSVQSNLYRNSMLEQLLWAEILDFKRKSLHFSQLLIHETKISGWSPYCGIPESTNYDDPFCWSLPSSVRRQIYVKKIEKILLNNRDLSASENMN